MRWFWLLLVLLLTSGCSAAAVRAQAQVADTVAVSANALLPMLVSAFRQQGLDAIARVKDAGGTKAEALEALQEVEAEWRPVWLTWESLRSAHGTWADELEAGGAGTATLTSAREAYCALLAVWPSGLVAPVPVVQCSLVEKSR